MVWFIQFVSYHLLVIYTMVFTNVSYHLLMIYTMIYIMIYIMISSDILCHQHHFTTILIISCGKKTLRCHLSASVSFHEVVELQVDGSTCKTLKLHQTDGLERRLPEGLHGAGWALESRGFPNHRN